MSVDEENAVHFLRRSNVTHKTFLARNPTRMQNPKRKEATHTRTFVVLYQYIKKETLNVQTLSHFLLVRCVASVERISQRQRGEGVNKKRLDLSTRYSDLAVLLTSRFE